MLRNRDAGLSRRLVQFRLKDAEPLLFHNEAVVRDGKIVGTVTSGNYGHHLGGAIGMGYVPCGGESEADVLASSYEIEIAGERFAAEASLKPMYDPSRNGCGCRPPKTPATCASPFPGTRRGIRRRAVHVVMRDVERAGCRGAECAHAAQDGLAAGLAHQEGNPPGRAASGDDADLVMCGTSETMRPPSGGSLKATSVAQTRSSQPFSMAGMPYHQVG